MLKKCIKQIGTNPLASGGNLTTTFPISAPGNSTNFPCCLLFSSTDFCGFDGFSFFLVSVFLFLRTEVEPMYK